MKTIKMVRDTVAIWMKAPLQHLLITVKVVALEKVSFSDVQNAKRFFQQIDSWYKDYLLNRDELTQPIQAQLSQKLKDFCEFFFAFLKSLFNFKHLPKNMTLIVDVFKEIPAWKI